MNPAEEDKRRARKKGLRAVCSPTSLLLISLFCLFYFPWRAFSSFSRKESVLSCRSRLPCGAAFSFFSRINSANNQETTVDNNDEFTIHDFTVVSSVTEHVLTLKYTDWNVSTSFVLQSPKNSFHHYQKKRKISTNIKSPPEKY